MPEPGDERETQEQKVPEEPEVRETCGVIVFVLGGLNTTVNLFATRKEVIDKIQDHLSVGRTDLIQFETANPDEQELFLIDPKKILFMMVKKEFLISGNVVPVKFDPRITKTPFRH